MASFDVTHGNISMVPCVNTLLSDKMVGTHLYPPYTICIDIHHLVYKFMNMNCSSLNPRPHGGLQMP
jgi:hypothetical protein